MYVDPDPVEPETLWTRTQIIRDIDARKRFDVAIIGGGIHGASMARLAALNGLSTVLLEMSDYASGASGKDSYLTCSDGVPFRGVHPRQIRDRCRAQAELSRIAPHLLKPCPVLFPLTNQSWWQRIQWSVGLSLYNFNRLDRQGPSRWLSPNTSLAQSIWGADTKQLRGCFQYLDDVVSGSRLVLETIFAARQEGARCLNYAKINSIAQQVTGEVHVGWTDMRSESKHQLSAGIVINCAGAWAPTAGRLSALSNRVRYSRECYLIFSHPWSHPALSLGVDNDSQRYFVVPHPMGALVYTVPRDYAERASLDSQPTREEVDQILSHLRRDLPAAGFDRSNLIYGFTRVNTVATYHGAQTPVRSHHQWELQGGMLTLYGGEFSEACATVFEGLRIVEKMSQNFELKGIGTRLLPGAFKSQEVLAGSLLGLSDERQIEAIKTTHARFGGQLRHISSLSEGLRPFANRLAKGTIEYCCRYEQAETLEDLFVTRLALDIFAGKDEALVTEVAQEYGRIKGIDVSLELQAFFRRNALLRESLGLCAPF